MSSLERFLKYLEKYNGPLNIYYIFFIKLTMKLINNLQLLLLLFSLNKSYRITKSEENIHLTINNFNNKDLIKIYISSIIFNIILLK